MKAELGGGSRQLLKYIEALRNRSKLLLFGPALGEGVAASSRRREARQRMLTSFSSDVVFLTLSLVLQQPGELSLLPMPEGCKGDSSLECPYSRINRSDRLRRTIELSFTLYRDPY